MTLATNNTPDESSKADEGQRDTRDDGVKWCSDSEMSRATPDVSLAAVSGHAVTLRPVLRVNSPVVVARGPFGRNDRQRVRLHRQKQSDDGEPPKGESNV